MVRSMAVEQFEEGEKKGLEKGLEEGLERGRAAGLRDTILALGEQRLGSPRAVERRRLMSIHDANRLNAIVARILEASTWDDLLSGAAPRGRTAKR